MGMMNKKEYKSWKPGQKIKPVLITCQNHGGEGCSCPTKQEFAKESDINEVMKRYPAGVPLPAANVPAVFADVSEIGSYADVLRRVDAAKDAFMQLPPQVRSRFDNDPQQLLEFLGDRKNLEEAIELGLAERREPKAPKEVPGKDPKVSQESSGGGASASAAK